jgi:LysM repeat protein
MQRNFWLRLVLFAILLPACSTVKLNDETATLTPQGTLHPYQVTRVVTASATPSLAPTFTLTPLPTATPTPLTYKVNSSDDMFGVALRFGVSLAALKTANPTVNPRAMSPGTVLVIPLTALPPGAPTSTPLTPTAAPVTVAPPVCYSAQDGGLWCYLLVKNELSLGLENLTAQITLAPADPAGAVTLQAVSLLNILPAGSAFPLAAFFPDPPAGSYTISAQLLTVLPQPDGDQRYLPANLAAGQVLLAEGRLSARLNGTINLPAGLPVAKQVRLLAVAYAQDGQVAGVRAWEAPSSLSGGASLAYDFSVYSLQPQIDHVTVMVEARP